MPTCEYCGEEFTKGGAFAMHVRYCDGRPETEDRERSDAASAGADVNEDGTEQGIAIEISDSDTETGSQQQETAETPPRGDQESPGGPDERLAGRWVAALVLIIVVAVVWRLLGNTED